MFHSIRLVQTCSACPEQYDAFIGDKQVGYLRLRHGWFRVDCPDYNGKTVYEASPKGDGCFEEAERQHYLDQAKLAIQCWLEGREYVAEIRKTTHVKRLTAGHGQTSLGIEIYLDSYEEEPVVQEGEEVEVIIRRMAPKE